MPRPCKSRSINLDPQADFFKPRGTALGDLEVFELGIDELEAMRLADMEGMYQADAAEKMGISRQTFGNIINSARKKVASALINGAAIKILERSYVTQATRPGRCRRGRRGRNINCELSRSNESDKE